MSLVADIAKELLSMFLADARLTTATLLLVVAVAVLIAGLRVDPMLGGALLLLGSLLILVEAALREARRRRRS
jgi:hypothetical protein